MVISPRAKRQYRAGRATLGGLPGVLTCLPFDQAIKYFGCVLANFPEFWRKRAISLALADAMVKEAVRVKYKGANIVIDCPRIDEILKTVEVGPAFSGVREMYCKDVYLRPFDLSRIRFRTVIDAGANIGLFTIFAAKRAARVISIEPQTEVFSPALSALRADNQPLGEIVHVPGLLMGSRDAGHFPDGMMTWLERSELTTAVLRSDLDKAKSMSIPDVMTRFVAGRVEFMKMDIEGFEFLVFDDADQWLNRIDNIAMEVHPEVGDPREIEATLLRQGFDVITDQGLGSGRKSTYLYASAVGALKISRRQLI